LTKGLAKRLLQHVVLSSYWTQFLRPLLLFNSKVFFECMIAFKN